MTISAQTSVNGEPGGQQNGQLPTIGEVISIDELHNRKYKLDDLITELQLLKNKISTLRYEMISLMRAMATLNEDDGGKSAQECFNELQNRVVTLKGDIDEYIERYKKIQPLIPFAKKELGKPDKPMSTVLRQDLKVGEPLFASNRQLFNGSGAHEGVDTAVVAAGGSARGGRGGGAAGGAKRGTTARKPRGRGGATAAGRQNSRGGSKGGATPQSAEYLGATPSEPILL